MKKVKLMLITLVLACMVSGCGSEFAGGAAAGAAATGAITGMTSVYQEQEKDLQTRYQVALAKLEKATTEAEKLAAQAEADTARKELERNQTIQAGLNTAKDAVTTNWTDPASVSNFSLTAAVAWAAWYMRRKASSSTTTTETKS